MSNTSSLNTDLSNTYSPNADSGEHIRSYIAIAIDCETFCYGHLSLIRPEPIMLLELPIMLRA